VLISTNRRIYRDLIKSRDLCSFEVDIKESDLLVLADKKLPQETEDALIACRKDIEQYIFKNPIFKSSFRPIPLRDDMPAIVKEMVQAAQKAGVGPMAAVAGAIAEYVGKNLFKYCQQVIVENGGDIFLQSSKMRRIGIYAGESPLSGKIALEVKPEDTPLGICCSAGTFGQSESLGTADAVIILSSSAALADAVATAVGNLVKKEMEIKESLKFLKGISGIRGGMVIKGNHLGAWGKIKIVGRAN